ncbi:MAG: hypothetical protein JSV54_04715 [Chloroflexota bacterium]|nr:MAG: hypothetical protein JSV54_04715 [Chloroflexota bacterium]
MEKSEEYKQNQIPEDGGTIAGDSTSPGTREIIIDPLTEILSFFRLL